MSFLLVTNDDGVDSPSLVPFMRALSSLAPVRAVVPARERSWIGKAITRFEDIEVETITRDDRPQMVVSGINLGLNHGLAFLLSSGTVGAAIEGWIADIPSVAFSTGDLHDHGAWGKYAWTASPQALWDRAAQLSADVLDSIREAGFPQSADVISVNFPHDAETTTPRLVTELALTGYDSIFRAAEPGRYVHDFSGSLRVPDKMKGTDLDELANGNVTITPIRLTRSAPIDDAFRAATERR